MIFAEYPTSTIWRVLALDIIIFLEAWVLVGLSFRQWRASRAPHLKMLVFMFGMYGLSISVFLLGWIEVISRGMRGPLFKAILPFTYSFLLVGHFFGLLFCKSFLQMQKRQHVWVFFVILLALIIAVFHPNNFYTLNPLEQPGVNIRPFVSGLMLLYSVSLYSLIMFRFFRAYFRLDDQIAKKGVRTFLFAGFCMIMFNIFVVVDEMYCQLTGDPGFTVYLTVAYGFLIVLMAAYWWGVSLPIWLKSQMISQLIDPDFLSARAASAPQTSPHDPNTDKLPLGQQMVHLATLYSAKKVIITCPECHQQLLYHIPQELIDYAKASISGVAKISIPAGLVCPHNFLVFFDKYLQIRGSEHVDINIFKD